MKKVKDVMFTNAITVQKFTKLKDLLDAFATFHTFPLVPVVEEDGTLIGIISLKNVVDVLNPAEPEILKTIPFLDEKSAEIDTAMLSSEMGHLILAYDIMDSTYLVVEEDMPIEEAFRLMRFHNKDQLPVINKSKKFTGVIGIFDVLITIFKEKGIL